MIIENERVVLIDLSEVASATFVESCPACGLEDSTFQRKMEGLYYINISKSNTNRFRSYATADFDNNKIKPGTIKVYPCRGNDRPPVFVSDTLEKVKTNIIDFYNAFRSTDAALDADLAEKMALAIREYYLLGDTKKKCEEAVKRDFPKKIYQSKAFGPILEKWINLRFNASSYRGNVDKIYTPDISIKCKPYIAMCPLGQDVKINVVKKDGTTETYCKSALIIINRRTDFGYTINSIVTLEDLADSAFSNWPNYLSANSAAYQQGILTRAEAALNSPLPNAPVIYAPAGRGGAGPIFKFRLSNSRSNIFSIQVAIPIGSGPEFGQNWFYTPVTTFAVSPDAIATMYNQYQNYLAAKRQAAEEIRQANNTVITTPNPPETTPPTDTQTDPEDPVVTPDPTPTDPIVTDPTDNGQGDGTTGEGDDVFDPDL